MRMRRSATMMAMAMLLTGTLPAMEQDGPPRASGLDVGRTVRAVGELVAPAGSKPWSDELAALSSDDASAQRRAIGALVRRGVAVLPDLAVLAKDRDPLLRARVVEVAAGIGGAEAAPLLLELSRDRDGRVREPATLGLGRCDGAGVHERLCEQLAAAGAAERVAAAHALATRRDPRALAPLSRLDGESDDLARRAMGDALARVAHQAESVDELGRLIAEGEGKPRDALLVAAAPLRDPRLCPVLTALLAPSTPAITRWHAARALAANGDSRAWEALCAMAADAAEPDLREAAAAAMRSLVRKTGSGQAWTLWWRDHAASAPRTIERDRLLADLHQPDRAIDRAALGRFAIDELAPMVDGALGAGARWWPARAVAAMRADDADRWTQALAERLKRTPESFERLALIILIDELGGPRALEALRAAAADVAARSEAEAELARAGRIAPDRGPERVALRVAFERRNERF